MVDRTISLEDHIRAAVASGEFAKARALCIELGDRLRQEAGANVLPAARLRRTRELLAWCRTMAIAGRAHCQLRLNQLAVSRRYLAPPADPRRRLLVRL
jgi:hypothetical protein